MKIRAGLPDFDCHIFNTKEEWDRDSRSEAWHRQWVGRNLPYYSPRAYREPTSFPCLGLVVGITYNPNGADDEHIYWVYEFEVEEE